MPKVDFCLGCYYGNEREEGMAKVDFFSLHFLTFWSSPFTLNNFHSRMNALHSECETYRIVYRIESLEVATNFTYQLLVTRRGDP